jgi:hypothetical protein
MLKTEKDILQRIENVKISMAQNKDRLEYFTRKDKLEDESKRIEVYNNMIKANESELNILYWVLNIE